MRLSNEFFVRLIGAIAGAMLAGYLGARLSIYLELNSVVQQSHCLSFQPSMHPAF